MESRTTKLRALVVGGGVVAAVAVGLAVGAAWILYTQTISLLTENLRERLLSISITQAANIDAKALQELQIEEDWVKPEWREVVSDLKKAKDQNESIVFMYIFRKKSSDPLQMEFVADAESINPYANTDDNPRNDVDANGDGLVEADGADKLQWPGQDYPEAVDIPEAYEAYNGPLTAAELYEDSYGQVLTGYAPITDSEGRVVAILATDIKAGDFFTVTRQTLYPFLIFIGVLTLIIAILSITLIFIWDRRAVMLAKLSLALEAANKQQESLLHFISHEVKGYLTKSEAAFAGILEGDFGDVTDTLRAAAGAELIDTRKGVATVMEILSASDMQKGTVDYTMGTFDLAATVREELAALAKVAEDRSVRIEASLPANECNIVGDKKKVAEHLIRNLIDNAIKYSPKGSVHVSLERKRNWARFMVKDTGVGLTADDKKMLFTEGGKGKDSLKVNVDSTGYGLYIAKQIADAHKGKIWAESEGRGKGSMFIVELPTGV
ncbi:MAG: PAS/PAC sensor signal transduction histidine kinase [Parcubacteria group bacterium Gr01-1014_8]|nr:MAG: PAS/PAC sensor signal transduction histidine kinase [Parcubacteria group bacterium Gr01-1014_8]